MVSIHAPTRGATPQSNKSTRRTLVSIHAPTRGATKVIPQNKVVTSVSIHAPTRGATYYSMRKKRLVYVSIHAPTRGATQISHISLCFIWFQSTHPHGVRLKRFGGSAMRSNVSIHAPTRGATHRARNERRGTRCFNPRTHTGCDT